MLNAHKITKHERYMWQGSKQGLAWGVRSPGNVVKQQRAQQRHHATLLKGLHILQTRTTSAGPETEVGLQKPSNSPVGSWPSRQQL